ncbi:hypothetical protein J2X57_003738 [Luteibacter sp. 1214]|nr:hypothetical protein [Luteibacter sp. 1214]
MYDGTNVVEETIEGVRFPILPGFGDDERFSRG